MKYLIVLLSLIFILSGCANQNNNITNDITNNSNVQISRTSVNNTPNDNAAQTVQPAQPPTQSKEEEIASASTPILNYDNERQNNVRLACVELNGKVINSGERFSFNGTMGPATPAEGYQKADTFDKNGKIIQEYGGGKCQVSTTLYNAVSKVSGLAITERHEHSGYVPYVPNGMDATVAYGSVDFEFINNNSFAVKIYCEAKPDTVTVRIVKVI